MQGLQKEQSYYKSWGAELRILIIIPAYNEEKSIPKVIEKIFDCMPESDIMVINDGSKDNTALAALNSGAKVINLPFNLGIGGAMQTGFLFAKRHNYDIAIQIDGDGQHNPEYVEELIKPIIDGEADMVIGSRFVNETKYRSSFFRKIGIVFFSGLVSFLIDQKIADTTSGFRAVNKKVINYFSEHYPTDYPEVDVLIKLYKNKFKITEIPVEMNQRMNGKSSITPIRSIYYMVKVSLSVLLEYMRTNDKMEVN